MDKIKIGQSIKNCRKQAGLTQRQLGKAIGRAESSIAQYESGKVEAPVSVLQEICRVCQVPFSTIMDESMYGECTEPDRVLLRKLTKRNGTTVEFDANKIRKAIERASKSSADEISDKIVNEIYQSMEGNDGPLELSSYYTFTNVKEKQSFVELIESLCKLNASGLERVNQLAKDLLKIQEYCKVPEKGDSNAQDKDNP